MLPQMASAQDEDTFKIDEVVVTARKRAESLQDVPLAVTALDASAIESAHISTISGIDKLVPNIDLGDNPFAGQGLVAVIRGVGFSDPEKSYEPVVGLSIDGIFLASNTGAAFDAFDLESVEVLRGPQGTLFGRNTVGGVINVKRTRPTGEAGLKVGTRITNNSGKEFLGVANLPQIGGALSTKIYAFKKDHDTFAVNTVTGEKDKQKDLLSLGASFLYEPNDRLEALVSVDYFDDNSLLPPTYNSSLLDPGFSFLDSDLFCFLGTTAFQGGNIPNGVGCASASLDVAEASNFDEFVRGEPSITHIDGWSATSNIEYQLNENLTLTSVTGYRKTTDQQITDSTHGPNVIFAPGTVGFPLFVDDTDDDATQFSQELRLSGSVSDKFDFVTGLYYLDSEYSSERINTAFNSPTPDLTFTAQQAKAYAVFVDGTYDITDRLSVSGGLRYSYEEKDFQVDFIFRGPIDTNFDNIPDTPSPLTGQTVDETDNWSNPTYRAILQYDVSDDAMIYGGYSRGFRSGGFNGRGGTPATTGTPFDEETVDSFEIGARMEFFDNRVRINPTAFLANYNDKQEERLAGVPGTTTFDTFVENAASVDIKGLELEVLARLTEELTVRGAFGYVDAEFDEFLVPDLIADATGAVFVDVSDQRNLRAGPDRTVSVGASYNRTIMDGRLLMTLNADYSFQGDTVTSAGRDPMGLGRDRLGSNNSTDFSASIKTLREGSNLTLTAFINDAFDDAPGRLGTQIFIPRDGTDGGIFGFSVGTPTKIYGLEATVDF